jgi:hypothetical protein
MVGDEVFDVTLASFVTVIVVVGSVDTGAVIALAFHACTHGWLTSTCRPLII